MNEIEQHVYKNVLALIATLSDEYGEHVSTDAVINAVNYGTLKALVDWAHARWHEEG
jgi:hypothetical protein